MNDTTKGILFILLVLYVVSPVDLCPGPIDDIILMLAYYVTNKGSSSIEG